MYKFLIYLQNYFICLKFRTVIGLGIIISAHFYYPLNDVRKLNLTSYYNDPLFRNKGILFSCWVIRKYSTVWLLRMEMCMFSSFLCVAVCKVWILVPWGVRYSTFSRIAECHGTLNKSQSVVPSGQQNSKVWEPVLVIQL